METQILEIIQRLERIERLISTHLLKEKRWLTVQEFTQVAGLNSKYVSELCKTGKIEAVRSSERHGPNFTWRIRQQELERYQREGLLMD